MRPGFASVKFKRVNRFVATEHIVKGLQLDLRVVRPARPKTSVIGPPFSTTISTSLNPPKLPRGASDNLIIPVGRGDNAP